MELTWLKNYNLIIFDEIDSTNSEGLRMAKSESPGDVVILAKRQTVGRGQKGNLWESLPGNLHATILLKITATSNPISNLSFVMANAVYETIAELCNTQEIQEPLRKIELKWPNDVLIEGKKVAGILLESITISGKKYVVIGIGVNVQHYPAYLNLPITSLKNEGINLANPDKFLNILMNKFNKLYLSWQYEGGFEQTRNDWLKRAYNLNNIVTIDNGLQRISGIFKSIEKDGSIILELASGQICNFAAGKVLISNLNSK